MISIKIRQFIDTNRDNNFTTLYIKCSFSLSLSFNPELFPGTTYSLEYRSPLASHHKSINWLII
jgi:hypothetical protein